MQALAAVSVHCEAWRAGFEVGEKLAPLAPEVVLLFTSIHYEGDFPGLFDGLREGLGNPEALVFGCTGDSVIRGEEVFLVGVSALGLTSRGALQWTLQVEPGGSGSGEAARRCAGRLAEELGGAPSLALALAGGPQVDGVEIVQALNDVLACPLMGGLAGDDRQMLRSYVFARGRAWPDAVALLGARGPLRCALHSASGFRPLDGVGVVDGSAGSRLLSINGRTAQEFLRDQVGKAAGATDIGTLPLAVHVPGGHFAMRTPWHVDSSTDSFGVFGSLPLGTEVRACHVSRDDSLEGVREQLRMLRGLDFPPAFVVAVSCAGRRWLFGDRYDLSVRELGQGLGEVPVVGFLSFGEIGPFREPDGSATPAHFHNNTLVLGAFGG